MLCSKELQAVLSVDLDSEKANAVIDYELNSIYIV